MASWSSVPWRTGYGLLIAVLGLGSTARAHDMWLAPSAFVAEPGEAIAVRLHLGHAHEAEVLTRENRRIVRFEAVSADRTAPVLGLDGHDPAGHVRPSESGWLVLAYESDEAFSELPAARFEAYATEEGLTAVLTDRQARGEASRAGTELYARSLKSLVRVGDAGPLRDRPVGLPLEMVLAPDTADASPDGTVRMRVLWRGEPLPGSLVDFVPLGAAGSEGGEARSARSDDQGFVHMALSPGTWMASCVHAERARGAAAARAQWRTVFASLTFALPGT